VVSNLQLLNKNLESSLALGRDFNEIAGIWTGLKQNVAGNDEQDQEDKMQEE
jgi:hypothetical protein